MLFVLTFLMALALRTAQAATVVEPGPRHGIALQDVPGLLLTNCRIHTQRLFVRLDPWDVYHNHIKLPPRMAEGRPIGQTEDAVEHARITTTHMLDQLQKFLVTEKDLSGNKRPKRFLGALLTAASAIGSLFSVGLSAANSVSLRSINREISVLNDEMPEIRQRLTIQTKQLQQLGKTLQGTIVAVNLHSMLINNTLHAIDHLSEIVKIDITYVRVVRDLMHDLLREISSSVNNLSSGRIPPYLVPLEMVEKILQSTTTSNVHISQVHLAYSLGSAIPVHVDPKRFELGFLLNLPIIEQHNIYRLKSVLNVGFWEKDVHVHIDTPPMLAYHDSNPSLYLIPNLNMCMSTKDIHWVCPSNPFIRDSTNRLCGFNSESLEQQCAGKLSLKDQGTETRVERTGNRWMVNTPSTEILVAYDLHDTMTRMKIPNQTVFLSVPTGATIHIDDITLHHLSTDKYDTEIDIIDAFLGHDININEPLQKELIAEGTKLVKFNLDTNGLTTTFTPSNRSPDLTNTFGALAFALMISGWIITAFLACSMHKHIQTLHRKLDNTVNIPDALQLSGPRTVFAPRVAANPPQEQTY